MLQDPVNLAEAELLAERADAAIYDRRGHIIRPPHSQKSKQPFQRPNRSYNGPQPMDVDQLSSRY